MLTLCQQHDVAWVPYFPLGSAFPGIAKVSEHPAVTKAAAALGATPAQTGLAWLLAHDPGTLLIPGTSNPRHLQDNIATTNVHLDPATMDILDHLAAAPAALTPAPLIRPRRDAHPPGRRPGPGPRRAAGAGRLRGRWRAGCPGWR